MFVKKIQRKIKRIIDDRCRKWVIKRNENFDIIVDKDISIIASNCNGGILCKDLGLRFNSPFVNLWIRPRDFIKMLNNLKEYLEGDLQFIESEPVDYPVAILRDIKLYFMHYKSDIEAAEAWYRRRDRINYNDLLVMFTDRDGCTYEDLRDFDKLDYKKVVFTASRYNDIKSSFVVKEFEGCQEVGILTDYIPTKYGVRYYDSFNFKRWIEG